MRYRLWRSLPLFLVLGVTAGAQPKDKLFSRIYGCEAAATIANAMGASVEGWDYERIEQTYGLLDKFVPEDQKESTRPVRFGQKFQYHAYLRQPGWGEDGMERYRLLTNAILKKNGRVNIEDVAREWIENVDPQRFGYNVGPQDQVIYYLLKAGLPPWEAGRWALWPGFMGTSKMILPIGMVNAGRPDNANRDALDITRFKDVQGRPLWRDDTRTISKVSSVVYDYALENAGAIAAATAEAIRPDATVASVIDAALAQLPPGARIEVETMLSRARGVKDWKEFRPIYQRFYQGKPVSAAIEILAGGLSCFLMADGHPREAILYAVNLGRDTDCKAYVAGGLAGALRGIEEVPAEWVATVEKAVLTDPYTVSKRTAREAAEGIYRATVSELRKSQAATAEIESMLAGGALLSRMYGAEAAGAIGSWMGTAREQQAGRRQPQRYGPDWVIQSFKRVPGMTDEGMERERLMTSAILKKSGRVNVEEVGQQWIDDIDPAKFGFLLGSADRIIYDVLKAGIPPWDAGRYAQAPGFIGAGRMMMPVGMVNAGRPDEAARDALDIGRLTDVQGRPLGYADGKIVYNYALETGAAIAAATAEALRPKATVDTVVEAALAQLPAGAREEAAAGIDWARKAKSWKELSPMFEKAYAGRPPSNAVEVLSSSLACLIVTSGQPREAIHCGAGLGRDAASRAHLAGGWAGALRGIQAVPAEWVETVEKEAAADPYTVSRRTARQAAEGIYKACLNELGKTKAAGAATASLMAN